MTLTNETKEVFVAYTNSDRTEGKGHDIPIAVCVVEATAIRLAKGQYVQGTDGPVRRVELLKADNRMYIPLSAVNIVGPEIPDMAAQRRLDLTRITVDKAKAAGLTVEEINLLRSG